MKRTACAKWRWSTVRKACLIAKSEPLDADKEALVEKLLVRMQGRLKGPRMQVHQCCTPRTAKLAEVTALLP
ncbi:MAG: hypothetical protein ACLUNV_09880, partial [Sutterella wadsworthensis]